MQKWTGAGALVAVGYIDPGNWATDIAGGSLAGFSILFVVLFASIIAMFLQLMSARLGIATGKDLALLSRERWPRVAWPSWIMAELSIIATDLAEVLGSALALQLLFKIPLILGVMITILDVFLLLYLQRNGLRSLVRLIVSLLFLISCGFLYELILASPVWGDIVQGFFPSPKLLTDKQLLYLSIAVIGATVMPHNLYLHSYLVLQNPKTSKQQAKTEARFNTMFSLFAAMLLNAAIVVLSASVFHHHGHVAVDSITEAHHLISPLLGTERAGFVLAILLLASGQSATITGALAGQVIMEGYIQCQLPLWSRRLITRGMALLPILGIMLYYGEEQVASLFVSSQVFLSIQLPFAIAILIALTANKPLMGDLVNSRLVTGLGLGCALLIIVANVLVLKNILM